MSLQSMLFVPGNRPERFAKALASGADSVCIDLEDALPEAEKGKAPAAAIEAVGWDPRFAVRINAVTTRHVLHDLLAIAESAHRPGLIFLPKVEHAVEVTVASKAIGDSSLRFVPLIETVRGIEKDGSIAADPSVEMLMLGS